MNQTMCAPVVVFGYNRPDLFRATLFSLKKNILAEKSDLYIYIDGPRKETDKPKINEVTRIANEIDGFLSKTIICSKENKGLAKSIIQGTTEVIHKYGKIIVLEDDLYLSPGFLTFMNTMLDAYEKDARIFQISGFGTKVKVPKRYSFSYYLNTRAQSWSWATWQDRWDSIDWEINDYCDFLKNKGEKRALLRSGSEFINAINAYMAGDDIWYICFMYNMFRQRKYCICPIRSFVKNDGFREDATHTLNFNRFSVDFDPAIHEYSFSEQIEWNQGINKSAVKYWTKRYRIYGKIRTVLSKVHRMKSSK